MASDVDCKQNQSMCSLSTAVKNVTISTNTVTQSIRHILILLFFCGTRPITRYKINY